MAFEAVEELDAARLADIHQRHDFAVERRRRRQPRAARRRGFGGGIAHLHGLISFVTDWHSSRTMVPGQPPMMAENNPAGPPARTIKSPPGANLSSVMSASLSGTPFGTPCAPSPWNSVTAFLPAAMPRRWASGSQSGSLSSSAKQKVYLPGLPKVARSMAPGMPPPTLRTISCRARPMVALARLPWPNALTPLFMPIRRATGPL